jgi:Ca-activated chloride channel family protein
MGMLIAAIFNGTILSVPLAGSVWLALRVSRRWLNAATRYAVWWIVLALVLILPARYISTGPFPAPELRTQAIPRFPSHPPEASAAPTLSNRAAEPAPLAPPATSARTLRIPVRAPVAAWYWTFFGFWMIAALVALMRLFGSYTKLRKLRAAAIDAPPSLAASVRNSLDRLRTKRRVAIAIANNAILPMVAGPFKPTVLLPAHLLSTMNDSEIEQICLHEAAHLARFDDWVLILQRIAEALFVLHPLVRWIGRRINLEREVACDDLVISLTGLAKPYAACLTHVAELANGYGSSPLAAAVSDERSQLTRRVEMLLDRTRHKSSRLLRGHIVVLGSSLVLLTFFSARTPGLFAFLPAPNSAHHPSVFSFPIAAPSIPAAAPPVIAQVPIALGAQGAAPAVQPSSDPSPDAYVRIPVSVTDMTHRFVTGLGRDSFRIIENEVEQKILSFGGEDAPLSIGILLDTSDSVGAKLAKSRQAVAEIFKAGNPEDEAFLVGFNDKPEVVAPLTHNLEGVLNQRTFGQSRSAQGLLDGALLAIHTMKNAHNPRRALVVISDEGGSDSRYAESDVRNLVKESDVPIYAVEISESGAARPVMLRDISEPTGGRLFVVENSEELPDVASKIGIEIRSQYVIGYVPMRDGRPGEYQSIDVRVAEARGLRPLTVRFRPGYYTPAP